MSGSVNRTRSGLGRDVNLKDDQGNGGVRLYGDSASSMKILDSSGNEGRLAFKRSRCEWYSYRYNQNNGWPC